MTHQGFSFLHRINKNAVYISVNSRVFFLHLKHPRGVCEVNTNITIDFLPQSPSSSISPQSKKMLEVLIVCSSGIDYSMGREEWHVLPKSLLHIN